MQLFVNINGEIQGNYNPHFNLQESDEEENDHDSRNDEEEIFP